MPMIGSTVGSTHDKESRHSSCRERLDSTVLAPPRIRLACCERIACLPFERYAHSAWLWSPIQEPKTTDRDCTHKDHPHGVTTCPPFNSCAEHATRARKAPNIGKWVAYTLHSCHRHRRRAR